MPTGKQNERQRTLGVFPSRFLYFRATCYYKSSTLLLALPSAMSLPLFFDLCYTVRRTGGVIDICILFHHRLRIPPVRVMSKYKNKSLHQRVSWEIEFTGTALRKEIVLRS